MRWFASSCGHSHSRLPLLQGGMCEYFRVRSLPFLSYWTVCFCEDLWGCIWYSGRFAWSSGDLREISGVTERWRGLLRDVGEKPGLVIECCTCCALLHFHKTSWCRLERHHNPRAATCNIMPGTLNGDPKGHEIRLQCESWRDTKIWYSEEWNFAIVLVLRNKLWLIRLTSYFGSMGHNDIDQNGIVHTAECTLNTAYLMSWNHKWFYIN